MPLEPFGHPLGLLDTFGREPPSHVGLAGLGLAVPPKNEIHRHENLGRFTLHSFQ